MVASVACGVPQGSVLGPLYYILYTSDVFKIIMQHGFRIHGYAEDLQARSREHGARSREHGARSTVTEHGARSMHARMHGAYMEHARSTEHWARSTHGARSIHGARTEHGARTHARMEHRARRMECGARTHARKEHRARSMECGVLSMKHGVRSHNW